jgi:hypothetical protein
MKILTKWALPSVGETVNKYWSEPERLLDAMLAMVRLTWKSTVQLCGNSGDFEDNGEIQVEAWIWKI